MLLPLHSVYSCSCSFLCLWISLGLLVSTNDGLSRLRTQNVLHLLLLVPVQRRAEDVAAITAELVRHDLRIGRAQKRVDRRVTWLDHRPNVLDKVIGDTEFILPPRSVDGACSGSEGAATESPCRNSPCRHRSTCSASEGDGEGGPDQRAPQTAPARAFAGGHLEALVNPELTVIVTIDGDCVVEVHGPVLVHPLQLVEHVRCTVHVFLEANDYQFRHDCSPFSVLSDFLFECELFRHACDFPSLAPCHRCAMRKANPKLLKIIFPATAGTRNEAPWIEGLLPQPLLTPEGFESRWPREL